MILAALGCTPPPPTVTLPPVEAIVFDDVHPLFGGGEDLLLGRLP